MNITAKLNDYRQSPRKVRLVSSLICGKKAVDALDVLSVMVKRASDPVLDLLKSAMANAKNNFALNQEDLFIKSLTVDGGAILYRRMPKARGMATPIRKRTSHITLVLGVKEAAKALKAPAKTKVTKKKANK